MAPMTEPEAECDDASLAKNRTKRVKHDKKGRFAALEKLRKAKESGEKYKYELKEENVYEEVSEKEYSRIVQDRQEDDWIVDDDGSGYVEDGREIFDDEMGGDGEESGSKKDSKKRAKNPNIRAPGSKPKSIKSMFAAASVKTKKKPEKDVSIENDNLLGDILGELSQPAANAFMPPPIKLKKKPAYNPFSTKSTPTKPATTKPLTPRNVTNEMTKMSAPPPPAPPKMKKLPKSVKPSPLEAEMDDIEAFDSQEENRVTATQQIEDPLSQPGNDTSMDISGIDFDDDMDDDLGTQKTTTNSTAKKEPVMDIPATPQTSWETVKGDLTDLPMDIKVDPSKLPLTANQDGEQVLRMFWLDAYEDQYKQPGTVYLFGKVWIESAAAHVSCCVAVKNIERRIFLLPRSTKVNPKTGYDTGEPVTFIDVYQEFNNVIAEKHRIMKFKSMKVEKDYAFELPNIPAQSEYLEVRYSAECPLLPSDLRGETFSHVFGTNTSSLELLLLGRKLKGPGWIDIQMPQIPSPPVSWCKVEAFINKPDYITVTTAAPAPPPLVVMTMSLRTVPNPKTHQNEVVAASCLLHHSFYMDKPAPKPHFQQHFCTVTKPADCVFPFDFKEKVAKQSSNMKVEVMGSERALLGFLLAKVHKVDPDIIVGHDIYGFDLDVLLHRISQNKIPHWSRLGRLKRANMPKLSGSFGAKNSMSANATSGRLVCDVKISAKELIRCRSYDLTELTNQILKDKRQEVDPDQIRQIYSDSRHLLQMLEWTLMDSNYVLRIMYELNVIPLALQITNICGNVMARTLMGGRAERNEYLLLHAFTEKNFVVPDKSYGKKAEQVSVAPDDNDPDQSQAPSGGKKTGRRKPAYAGGLVLEPKKGFYDKYILLLDFNSLYPSIIQEYNICFTTIARTANVNNTQAVEEELSLELPDPDLDPGILPTEIRKLVQSRRQVKQLMKNSDLSQELYMQYDIRQKALKLTANSMYGCLGFTFSRFYAKPLAALITGKGREILLKTKDLVQNMNLDVIYGDTDSIMVNTNCTDLDLVYKLGNKVKGEVNKLFKLLEIDIDGVFKSMLLLKKKKYAALTISRVGDKVTESQELKGLDIVRRDWCQLAKDAGNYVVSQILSGESRETILENIHSKLTDVGDQVAGGDIPMELYHITKSLTKNPEDYPDKKSLPHVQVALRVNSKGGKKMRGGDTVYYVICEDGTSQPSSQRAYHPDELAKRDDLKVDTKYYLANQIHPVVSRLCDPIDGTDAAHIAECLGLDPSGYQHALRQSEQAEDESLLGGASGVTDEERYADCQPITAQCPQCGREIVIKGVFDGCGDSTWCVLSKCPNPQCPACPAESVSYLQNRVTMAIRAHVRRYYEGWLHCEDAACGARTRKMSLMFTRGHPVCQTCRRGTMRVEYTDSALYWQLSYYQHIFDLDKAININKGAKDRLRAKELSQAYRPAYNVLRNHANNWISQSAYSDVNLSKLFQGLFTVK